MLFASLTSSAQRRVGLWVFSVLGFVLVLMGVWKWIQPARTNVILVTFDTTRADHMGVYGYQQGLTDSFDELARRGVVFERAYAPAPLTLPSHTTMLTGLYPPEHGLRVNGGGRLGSTIPTLPETLKKQGYQTAAFIASFVLNSKFGLGRGFEFYDDDLTGTAAAPHSAERRRSGESVVDSALNWLRHRTTRPFFCWIHLYDAHDEYDLRPELFGERFVDHPYDAGIAVEVQQLQRVLSFLKESKLDQSTVIIVAGDHGEGLGDHGEEEHGMFVYNSTLHVPLVIAGPSGHFKSGHRVSTSVSLADLTPTILDLLKLPPLKRQNGRSLASALSGIPLAPRPCYGESEAPFRDNRWCPLQTIITDQWKYIHTTKPELYDLQQDLQERQSLYDSHQDQRKEMLSMLEVMQEEFIPAQAQNINLSEKDLALLRSLGYVSGDKPGNQDHSNSNEVLADMKDMLPLLVKLHTARKYLSHRDFVAASQLAREITQATDQFPMAHVVLGDALRELGSLDEASAEYQIVLENIPEHTIARAHLGVIYANQGKFELAAGEFRQVIELEPEASQTHLDLAQTYIRLQKFDEAIKEYHAAIRSDPGFVAAHFQLGLILARAQRFQEAAESFSQAIIYDPNFAVAQTNLASMLLQLNQVDKALVCAKKAVDLDPKSFDAQFNLGIALLTARRFDEAIPPFQEASTIRPDDPRPLEGIQQSEAALRQRK